MTPECIVDASVAAGWIIPDERTASSLVLLERVFLRTVHAVAPELWRYEMLNVLRNAIVQERLDEQETRRALLLLADVPVEFVPAEPGRQGSALSASLRHGLSIYDAAYFALAEERGVRLLTNDGHLLNLREGFPWICTVDDFLAQESA